MNSYIKFDPLAWANNNANSENTNGEPRQQAAPVTNTVGGCCPASELDKARAVADELLRMGANIAESYDDYLQLGFSLANGLGCEGRDLYHALCAQSAKYRQQDCEKKWQECLRRQDGRTTIATFYQMAKDAGVDLSALSRQFSPFSPFSPLSPREGNEAGNPSGVSLNNSQVIDNNIVSNNNTDIKATTNNFPQVVGEMGKVGKMGKVGETTFFSETFSQLLDVGRLPQLLRDVVLTQDDSESRDMFLLSALLLYSGAMPNVYGLYHAKRVHTPFYLIIGAPSGSGKGALEDLRSLLMPIEYDLRRQYEREKSDYQEQMAQYNALDRKQRASQREPEKPKYRSLFIAANSSATAWQQSLADNGERGIMFETEADTLTQTQQQEYGNYSDALRKAFHHEQIKYSRRTDDEHVCIDHPQMAVLLTCTPKQIPRFLNSSQVENGLASRFLFYNLRGRLEWLTPFGSSHAEPLSDRIHQIGTRYQQLYNQLLHRQKPFQVVLTPQQQERFNDHFSHLLPEQTGFYGDGFDAFVYRQGLVAFRMMMVLSVLRCHEQPPLLNPDNQTLHCTDDDFATVIAIMGHLANHTAHVYTNLLPHDDTAAEAQDKGLSQREQELYKALPDEFTRADAQQTANKLNIAWKTAEKYMGKFVSRYHLVQRVRNGHYRKIAE